MSAHVHSRQHRHTHNVLSETHQPDQREEQRPQRRFSFKMSLGRKSQKTKTIASITSVTDSNSSGNSPSLSPGWVSYSSSLYLAPSIPQVLGNEQEEPQLERERQVLPRPAQKKENPRPLPSALKKPSSASQVLYGSQDFVRIGSLPSARLASVDTSIVTGTQRESFHLTNSSSHGGATSNGDTFGGHAKTHVSDVALVDKTRHEETTTQRRTGTNRAPLHLRHHVGPIPQHDDKVEQEGGSPTVKMAPLSIHPPSSSFSGAPNASFPMQPSGEIQGGAISSARGRERKGTGVGGKRNETSWNLNALEASNDRVALDLKIQALRYQIRQATRVLMHVVHTKSVPGPAALRSLDQLQTRSRQHFQRQQQLQQQKQHETELSGCACAFLLTGEDGMPIPDTDHHGLAFLMSCYTQDPGEFQGRVLRQVEAIQQELQFLRQEKLEIERRMTVRIRQYEHERVRQENWVSLNERLQSAFISSLRTGRCPSSGYQTEESSEQSSMTGESQESIGG